MRTSFEMDLAPAAEAFAQKQDCAAVYLDTLEFQALWSGWHSVLLQRFGANLGRKPKSRPFLSDSFASQTLRR